MNIQVTQKNNCAVILPDSILLDIILLFGGDKEGADLDLVAVPGQEELEDVVGAGDEVGDGVGVHLVANIKFRECLRKF